ncbi:hypothetical protein J1614_008602 [Plenodomus biglobosus]|nr:hypothetical protein J1614_008602 [Plenodomus biglobosus]
MVGGWMSYMSYPASQPQILDFMHACGLFSFRVPGSALGLTCGFGALQACMFVVDAVWRALWEEQMAGFRAEGRLVG